MHLTYAYPSLVTLREEIEVTIDVVDNLTRFGQDGSTRGRKILQKLRRDIRSVWLPTFSVLNTLIRSSDSATGKFWRDIKHVWIRTGQFGFASKNLASWVEHPLEERHTNYSLKRCFSKTCLCASHPHHLLKVCKGCWGAMYCNRKCQAQ